MISCDTFPQSSVVCNSLFEAFASQGFDIRKGDIGQGDGRSASHGTRNIGYCIVENTVFLINWLIVGCHAVSSLDNATLVNSHINNNRAGAHLLNHIVSHQFWCLSTRNKHGSNHDICFTDACLNVKWIGHEGLDLVAKDFFQYG